MKPFLSFILFCFSLVFVVSCKSRKPPEPVTIETTKTITQIVKDTVYKVEADSAFYYAWIDCQNGKPILRNEQSAISNRQSALANSKKSNKALQPPKVKLNGNRLEVECYQKAQELFKTWRETYIKENRTTKQPVYIEKPFRWYHKALMWTGGISLLLVALGAIIKFIKPF